MEEKEMVKKQKKRLELRFTRYIFPIFMYTIAILWCIVMMTIVLFAVITSFRVNIDFLDSPGGLPSSLKMLTFDNFKVVIEKAYLWVGTGAGKRKAFLPEIIYNTLFYSISNPLAAMITCACVSYVACRYRKFAFVRFLYPFTVIVMYLPLGASLATEISYLKKLGIYDNLYALPFYNCGAFGMDMLIYYATWQSFSADYGNAALIDGANPWQIFTKIYLPLGSGTFWSLFLMKFMGLFKAWNVNLTILPSYPLIGYLGYQLQYSSINEFSKLPVQVAGLLLISLPVLIIFMLGRKFFMSSMQFGGLKG